MTSPTSRSACAQKPAHHLMKTFLSLSLSLLLLCLSGCATVPQTVFTVDPKTGQVHVTSPKEIDLEGLKANVLPGGGFVLEIRRYRSHNSADVIASVAAANAAMAEKLSAMSERLVQSGAKAVIPVP
jgi:hypothetical protein